MHLAVSCSIVGCDRFGSCPLRSLMFRLYFVGGGHPEGGELRPQRGAVLWCQPPARLERRHLHGVHGRCERLLGCRACRALTPESARRKQVHTSRGGGRKQFRCASLHQAVCAWPLCVAAAAALGGCSYKRKGAACRRQRLLSLCTGGDLCTALSEDTTVSWYQKVRNLFETILTKRAGSLGAAHMHSCRRPLRLC